MPNNTMKYNKEILSRVCLLLAFGLGFGQILPGEILRLFFPFDICVPLGHVIGYAILCFTVCFYVEDRRSEFHLSPLKTALLAFGYSMAWGSIAEGLQIACPWRALEFSDILCNSLGSAAGILLFFGKKFFLSELFPSLPSFKRL
jgi:hypothetical protein